MDFSALNPRSTNSLNIAARNNNVDEVKRLLTNGGNWANCDNRGWCAIHEAAANDCWQTLSVLLKYQTDRHLIETFEGQTALYLACR